MVTSVKNANMLYQRKNETCIKCGKKLSPRKHKYCSFNCVPIYNRSDNSVKQIIKPYKGQCTEKIRGYIGVLRCPNQGLKHRDGKCNDCYLWMLKRKGIYPHKDNATRCTELYLVL